MLTLQICVQASRHHPGTTSLKPPEFKDSQLTLFTSIILYFITTLHQFHPKSPKSYYYPKLKRSKGQSLISSASSAAVVDRLITGAPVCWCLLP